jgi:hypothetical protein
VGAMASSESLTGPKGLEYAVRLLPIIGQEKTKNLI